VLGKRRHGRPLGSKNKKPYVTVVAALATLDLGLAQPILSQRSFGNTFCFFAFTDAQCRERQRLMLKFTKFMDGREISQAKGRHTNWRCGMTVMAMLLLLMAGRSLM
jgi:hypothetical protein